VVVATLSPSWNGEGPADLATVWPQANTPFKLVKRSPRCRPWLNIFRQKVWGPHTTQVPEELAASNGATSSGGGPSPPPAASLSERPLIVIAAMLSAWVSAVPAHRAA